MRDKLINKKLVIIAIALVFLLTIGFSYAWWRLSFAQDKANTAVSKCFKLELANQANEINLTNMYPITDEEGRALTPLTFTLKNTCSVSAKYSLNMEMLEGTTLNSNYLAVLVNNKDIKLLSSYNTATTVIAGSTESRTLDTGILAPNGSKDYSISLWMDKSVTLSDDAQNKTFKSKVVVDAVATETAMDKIIASVDTTGKCPTVNDDGSVNVTEKEDTDGYLCKAKDAYGDSYYYRGNVTNNYVKFGKWANDTHDVVYGYYSETSDSSREYDSMEACQNASSFNKNCTINNRAGKNMYWRIIRINGDGTVRVIYDGTVAHANGEGSADKQIGTSAFNSSYMDNAYVGYMYGNSDVVVESSEYYSSNLFSNTMTYYISKEYTFDENTKLFTLKNPIQVLGSNLTNDYIGYYYAASEPTSVPSSVDRLYKIMDVTAGSSYFTIKYDLVNYGTSSKEVAQTNTNDSTIKTYLDNWYKANILGTENEQYLVDNVFCNDRSISSSKLYSDYNNLGYGTNKTAYRWFYSPFGGGDLNPSMRLVCPQKNDAFTVSDTTNGNGALTYPVGLLSNDEIVLAGGWLDSRRGYYLYSGQDWWTSSPFSFDGRYASMHIVYGLGDAYRADDVYVDNGVRPVFNLKADILLQGSGTAEDPYHL